MWVCIIHGSTVYMAKYGTFQGRQCPCCQEGNLSGNLSTLVDPVKQSPNWNQSSWWSARVPAMLCYSVTEYLELEEWTRGDFVVRSQHLDSIGSIWTAVLGVTQRQSRFWTNVISLTHLKVGAGPRCFHRSLILIFTCLQFLRTVL